MLKTYLNPFGFVYFATKCWSFVSFWVTLTLLELEIINTSFPREIQKEIFTCFPFSFLSSSQTQNLQPDPEPSASAIFQNKTPFCLQKQMTSQTPYLPIVHWNKNQTTSPPKACMRMKYIDNHLFQIWKHSQHGSWPCPLCHFSGPTSGNSLGPTFKEKLVDHNLSSQNDTRD